MLPLASNNNILMPALMPNLAPAHGLEPAKSSGPRYGCLLLILALLAVPVFILAWPTSGWVLLSIPAVYLSCSRKARSTLLSLARDAELSPPLTIVRKRLIATSLLFALPATFLCLLEADGAWIFQCCFLTALLWLFAAQLLVVHCEKSKKKRRLQYALLSNMREFIAVVASALGLTSLAAIWIDLLPINQTTLQQLRQWEHDVETVHRFLEKTKLPLVEILALIFALWLLRLIDKLLTGTTAASDHAGKAVKVGLRWLERISLFIVVAASITFLGTTDVGPAGRIAASIKKANTEYSEFKRLVQNQVDLEFRRELLNRAWEQRPATLRNAMQHAVLLIDARQQLQTFAEEAKARFRLEIAYPQAGTPFVPPRNAEQEKATAEGQREKPAPDGLSPGRITELTAEAVAYKQAGEPSDDEKETGEEELIKKGMDKVSPIDLLVSHSDVLSVLKEHYPVFGEFISTISSAFTDATFQILKDHAVQDVIKATMFSFTKPLKNVIRDRALLDVQTATLDWSPYSDVWFETTDAHIAADIAAIGEAKAKLVAAASEKQAATLDRWVSDIRERELQIRKLGAALQDESLISQADSIEGSVAELVTISRDWPPLGSADASRKADLAAIQSRFIPKPSAKDMNLSDLGKAERVMILESGQQPTNKGAAPISDKPHAVSWSDPLTGLRAVDIHSIYVIVGAIGQSGTSHASQVHEALGPETDEYVDLQRKLEAVQQREIEREQRQQEQERLRYFREMQEQLRKYQEEHPVEHEVP